MGVDTWISMRLEDFLKISLGNQVYLLREQMKMLRQQRHFMI